MMATQFHAIVCLCLILTLCFITGTGSELIFEPEVDLPGDPTILVLFDFHRVEQQNGSCSTFIPRSVEKMLAISWIKSKMANSSGLDLGLVVYDVCGSVKKSVQIVNHFSSGCRNSTKVAGAILYSNVAVHEAVDNVLRPFGVLTLHISDRDYVSSASGTSFTLPTASLWKVQATVELLSKLNWNKVTLLTDKEESTLASRTLFSKLAPKYSVCTSSVPIEAISSLNTSSSGPVLVLTAKENDISSILKADWSKDHVIMLLADDNVDDETFGASLDSSIVVHVQEEFSELNELAAFVFEQHVDFESMDASTLKYFLDLKFCVYNDTTNRTVCSRNSTEKYFLRRLKGRDIVSTLSAFLTVHQSVRNAVSSGCAEFDFNSCQSSVSYTTFSFHQTGQPLYVDNTTSLMSPGDFTRITASFLDGNSTKMAEYNSSGWHMTDITSWNAINTVTCNDSCTDCQECQNSLEMTDKSLYQKGDFLIHGSFPITKHSPTGEPCGAWSWEGLQMAEAFRFAVQSVKSRYSDIFPGIEIGTVVTDSCKSGGFLNLNSESDCPINMSSENGTEMIPMKPSDIAAKIVFSAAEETTSSTESKPTFLVSPLGVSMKTLQFGRYMLATAELLKAKNWTYVNLVASDRSKGNFASEFKTMLQAKKICVSKTFVISSNTSEIDEDVKAFSDKRRKPTLFIFISHADDTLRMYNSLMKYKGSFPTLSFIIFPWNSKDIHHPGTIVMKPKDIIDAETSTHLKSLSPSKTTNNWWQKFHEDRHRCSFVYSQGMIYPRKCEDTPTYTDDLRVSPLTSFVRLGVDSAILTLDLLFKEKCPQTTGLCSEFFDSNNLDKHLANVKVTSKGQDLTFSSGGQELRIEMEFHNIKRRGNETSFEQVASFTSTDSLVLGPNSIEMYDYDQTPLSSVIHQCTSWCPECFPCNASVLPDPENVVYVPGDIVLGGLFPLHEAGQAVQTCGSLALKDGMEQLVEAFLFAASTAQQRYPYLLPNISVGAFVHDTCSDPISTIQKVMNFETCTFTFHEMLKPQMMTSYITYGNDEMGTMIEDAAERVNKLSYNIDQQQRPSSNSSISHQIYSSYSYGGLKALVQTLWSLNWTYVDILRSSGEHQNLKFNTFFEIARSFNICVFQSVDLAANEFDDVFRALVSSSAKVVVVLAEENYIKDFVVTMVSRPLPTKTFVFGEASLLWEDTDISLPLGSIMVDRVSKVNQDFVLHYTATKTNRRSDNGNHWLSQFLAAREQCRQNGGECDARKDIGYESSRVVLLVDFFLHALHHHFLRKCPEGLGECRSLHSTGAMLRGNDMMNISFLYQNETLIKYPFSGKDDYGSFTVKNFQSNKGYIKVGTLSNGKFDIASADIKFYDFNGNRQGKPESRCFGNCACLGDEPSTTETTATEKPDLFKDMELVYTESPGIFIRELWITIVVAIAAGGAFVSFMFIIYVIYKVCAGLLVKRYIGLGIFLLVSVISLYMSVLPFAFSPSKEVCAARVFVPGVSYALCFGALITKVMALRSYKYIGLGGELSNLNQFLTVVFISAVQVAMGVQHLVLKDKLHVSMTGNDGIDSYACFYDRKELVLNLIYVMCLIVICAFYAIIVRKETKNMGEAKLILICLWFHILVWIAWIVVLFLQPRGFVEPAFCVGILATATLVILIVFVPKLHRIARLKYDVKRSGMENGAYKIDSDFMFERPYTLPATSRNSFKYSEKTYPKSLSSFDTSLSY